MRSNLGRFHRPMSRGLVNNMLTMNNLGDGSTLSLDFTTMGVVLDPRLTFTRASTVATYINSSGYVATATTNEPRFDYSPTNIGQPRGLLIEGSSINACTYSEDFANAAWSKNNATQTPASGTSPDNTNTATLLAEIVGYGKHSLERSITVTAGNIYTFSVFLKEASSNSRRYACVQVADGQATAARNTVVFDLQTGTVTANGVTSGTLVGSPTDVAHSITSYRDGWYRVTVTMKFVSSPCYPVVMLSDISTLSGGNNQPFYTAASPVKGFLVYGAQVELGSGASSYIPTGASQVTRAVDTAIIAAGTNFSSWYTGGTTGTFVSNWYGSASSSTARSVIATSDVDDKHLHLYQTASALTLRLADFGALATVTTGNNLTANALTKGAFSYAGTATSLCLNGGTVATNTLGFSVAPTFLSIGGPSTTGITITDTSVMLNNSIRTIKYYPTRLTDAQIKDITT